MKNGKIRHQKVQKKHHKCQHSRHPKMQKKKQDVKKQCYYLEIVLRTTNIWPKPHVFRKKVDDKLHHFVLPRLRRFELHRTSARPGPADRAPCRTHIFLSLVVSRMSEHI